MLRRGAHATAPTGRGRTALALLATLAVLGPIGWFWQASLVPARYSVLDMGVLDMGVLDMGVPDQGRPGSASSSLHQHGGPGTVGVDTLRADPGPADVELTLTARAATLPLGAAPAFAGYTLNGTSPGPVIRAELGQLVQVRLVNESVPGGVTLHWHGINVPNAMDGLAGVTQDAVPVGGEFVYRFRAEQVGTYWYHSHQVAHEQVLRGLFGALVIMPPGGVGREELAVAHLYGGQRTLNGQAGDVRVDARPGERVRVRAINTDNGPMPVWVSGAQFRLLAVDGADLHQPGQVAEEAVQLTAGARADLEIVVPDHGARVEMSGAVALVLAPPGANPPHRPRPDRDLDLLSYGTPAALPFDPGAATRTFDYAVGRRFGFLDGVPGLWWTVNGRLFPDVPMYVVTEGDVVRMRVSNDSGEVHPMHLHGHHAVVLARNGVPATGSPWWVDSLNVGNGESYDIAFRADNPGIWMDHCHQLTHAVEGLTAHLMYQGVSTPYRVGGPNSPE
jgi:FtsP/CotA-like multicopper oxidase with cupredoxin domain